MCVCSILTYMKTIKISREIKALINEKYDMSPNQAIKLLIKKYERESVEGSINIRIDDDVLESLKSLKSYSSETHSSVILRLLLSDID